MPGEFELIQRYFSFSPAGHDIELGVGDDAALINLPGATHALGSNARLVVASDTLVSGTHFPADLAPAQIASRALRVNLSDFAAMGVRPRWYTLALTLPEADENWLAAFSAGLQRQSEKFGVALVGGDTTRGALSLTLTVFGVAGDRLLTRSAAQTGDGVWVTGELGRGGAALKLLKGGESAGAAGQQQLLQHFYEPPSLVEFGVEIANIARAAIDISDGLLADAGHIASASSVRLSLDHDRLPVDSTARVLAGEDELLHWLYSFGDEYQLLFTLPAEAEQQIHELASNHAVALTRIGHVEEGAGVEVCGVDLPESIRIGTGYQHF